ncbi:ParB family protein [Cardiobacterium hominis]
MSLINLKKNDAGGTPEQEEYARIIDLDINAIEVSHMNPRQTRGEHYDSTKESIRNIGLLQMLTVTKVPGQDHFTLYNGGNTRLSILKELYQEYLAAGEGDKAEAIRFQQCRYVPYTDDLDVLVKHMAENEERSDMTFIDKARAVFQIREIYLRQRGEESVSSRDLASFIQSLGWTRVNQRVMTELNFALDSLEKVIPQALNAGMGKLKIQQIRKWWGYVETYLQWLIDNDKVSRRADGTEQPYTIDRARQLYFATLAERDSDEMPIDIDEFLEDFRCRWALELQQYNPTTNSVRILGELEMIEEHGRVLEEVPMEELRQRLEETATVPISRWPEPRKPRTPRDPAASSANATAASGHDDDSGFDSDGDNGAGYAGDNGDEPFPDNPPTPPSGGADMAARKAAVPASLTPPKERDVQPVPFGPKFKYPDLRQSQEKLRAELRQLCTTEVEQLLGFFDASGLLRRLVRTEYQGDDPQSDDALFFDEAPFFYLALDNNEALREVHNHLLEANETTRFVTLYFIRTWMVYLRDAFHILEPGNATQQELNNYGYTELLWKEFGDAYNDTLFLCRCGLVLTQRDSEEEGNLRLADDIMLRHSGFLYTAELGDAIRQAKAAKQSGEGHAEGV